MRGILINLPKQEFIDLYQCSDVKFFLKFWEEKCLIFTPSVIVKFNVKYKAY